MNSNIDMDKLVAKISQAMKNMDKAVESNSKSIEGLTNSVDAMFNKVSRRIQLLEKDINKLTGGELNKAVQAVETLNAKLNTDSSKQAANIQKIEVASKEVNGRLQQISETITMIDAQGNKNITKQLFDDKGNVTKTLIRNIDEVEKKQKAISDEELKNAANKEKWQRKILKLETDNINAQNTLNNKISNANVKRKLDYAELNTLLEKQRNIISGLGSAYETKDVKNIKAYEAALQSVNSEIKIQQNNIKILESQSLGAWNRLVNKAHEYFIYVVGAMVTQQTTRFISNMVNEVKQLDASLVELRKVTDLEGESLRAFTKDAYEAGKAVAKTGRDMIEAATEFAKSGYNPEMALKLGEVALMYGNIADETISAGDSANFIIAQMKAFNIEAENAIHIIDAVNEVSNNFAVSSADIANNLGKASAVMANAGNSMEEYIGMMTAITEITRSADKAANGLKTITLRLQGMNDEGAEDIEVQAKMEKMFNKLGLSVYKANGELKSTYEIMDSLAPVYQTLTNAEKAYVTETIAGKFQAQNAAAALNNWAVAVEATETAVDSAGSAFEENEKVLDSIEGKMNALHSAFQELAQNVIDSGLIKGIADMGIALLEFANSGAAQFIAKTTLMFVGFKVGVPLIQKTVTVFKTYFAITKTGIASIGKLIALRKSEEVINIKGLATKKADIAAEKIRQQLMKQGLTAGQADAAIKKLQTKATKGQTTATYGQVAAQSLLNIVIGAGVIAFAAFISIMQASAKASKEAAEAAAQLEEDLRQQAIDSGSDLKERNDSLDDYINQYKGLKKELDNEATGYKRSVELRSEILELQEQINTLLGDENNGIDLINDSLEETIKKQNQIKINSAKDYMAENSAAIEAARKNLAKNYYGDTRNTVMTEEWRAFGKNLSADDFEKRVEAIISAMPFDGLYAYGYGGKNDNYTGFDKERFLDITTDMTANEAKDMWQTAAEKLSKNKKYYMDEFGLTEDDYSAIVATANTNYSNAKKYIEQQNEILAVAAESLVYSDDNHSKKITELQVASAEYNLAQIEGDQEAMDKAIQKIANIQDYVDKVDDDLVKNYFQDILDDWTLSIKQADVSDQLKTYFDSLENDLRDKLTGLNIDADTFNRMLSQFKQGITEGMDEETQQLFQQFVDMMEEGGYSVDDFTVFMENLGYVLPGATKATKDAVLGLSDLEEKFKSLNENIDSVQAAYQTISSAMDEYRENGYLTMDTMQALLKLDGRYLQHLVDENGQLNLNTQSFMDMANAQLDEAEAAAISEAMHELSILTSQSEQIEIDKLKTKYENLKTALSDAATGYDEVAASAAAYKAVEGISSEDAALADSIMNNLDAKLAIIRNTRSGIGKNFGKTMGASSSKGSGKSWWEEELKKLQDQFKYSEITIEEYISSLDRLLGKTQKGSDAWKKINDELQKQRLSKVEDDYKAGRISLEEYIKQLQNLISAYKEGTDAWNKLADKIKKGMQDLAKETQSAYDDAKKAIDATIDSEIDKLKEQIDALKDKNSETEREIELQRLKDALENAKNNKTKRVWNGSEWVWMADQAAIDEAQKALDDFETESAILELEKEIQALEDLKNAYKDVTEAAQKEQERQQLIAMLGANAESDILNDRLATLEEFAKKYAAIQAEIANLDKKSTTEVAGGSKSQTSADTQSGGSSSEQLSSSEIDKLAREVVQGKYGNGAARKSALGANYTAVQNRVNQMLGVKGYSDGGIIDYTGLAMVHGSPSQPEYMMNTDQMDKIVSSLTKPEIEKTNQQANKNISYNFSGDLNFPDVTNPQQFIRELKSKVNITRHSV